MRDEREKLVCVEMRVSPEREGILEMDPSGRWGAGTLGSTKPRYGAGQGLDGGSRSAAEAPLGPAGAGDVLMPCGTS